MEKAESEISDVAQAKLDIGMLKKMYADYMNVIGDVQDKIKYYDEYQAEFEKMQGIYDSQVGNVDGMDEEKRERFSALENKLKQIGPKMVDMRADIGLCTSEYLIMESTVEKIAAKINASLGDGAKKLDENKTKKGLAYVEGIKSKFDL